MGGGRAADGVGETTDDAPEAAPPAADAEPSLARPKEPGSRSSPDRDDDPGERPSARRRRRRRRIVLLAIAIPLGVLFVAALFVLWDLARLQGAAADLEEHAAGAQEALNERDSVELASHVSALEAASADVTSATDGPHWWLAAHLPWVSGQVVPVRTLGAAVEQISTHALAPLSDAATGEGGLQALEAPTIVDGRIDPYVLEPFRPALAEADATLTEQAERLQATDLAGTVELIRARFLEVESNVADLATTVTGAHVAAEVLPGMLGAESARHYLVVVQNNAEPRATGGIPAALIELTADEGRLTLGDYTPSYTLITDEAVGVLTEDEARIFTDRMAIYPQNANFTPEFPRTAQLLGDFWEAEHDVRPDAVLSIDPVALGWMLEGAPPTTVDGIDLTSDNLARVLMNEAYFMSDDPDSYDDFFARASNALFDVVAAGHASNLGGAERAFEARRLLVWSAVEDEQRELARTPASGAFLEDPDALGIFTNDGSGSKIGYYTDASYSVTDLVCPDGSLERQLVDVTLTHTFDGDVTDLPEYIAGGNFVPAGEFHASLRIYPAAGTALMEADLDGGEAFVRPEGHDGRSMAEVWVELAPGETATVHYEIAALEGDIGVPELVLTPGPRESDITRVSEPAGVC